MCGIRLVIAAALTLLVSSTTAHGIESSWLLARGEQLSTDLPGPFSGSGFHAPVDTTIVGKDLFVVITTASGATLIRDPRTSPAWHDLSSVPGYPPGVTDASLAVNGDGLHVTVRSVLGVIAGTTCTVNPTPGAGSTPAWSANCGEWVDLTPPLSGARCVHPADECRDDQCCCPLFDRARPTLTCMTPDQCRQFSVTGRCFP